MWEKSVITNDPNKLDSVQPIVEVANPFIRAVQSVAQYFDLPTSETVIISGIPIDLDNPSFEDIELVAGRLGLEIEVFQRRSVQKKLPELPIIVFPTNSAPFSILERTTDGGYLVGGSSPNGSNNLSAQELANLGVEKIISFSKIYINADDRKELEGAAKLETKHWLWGTLQPLWKNYLYVAAAALFINLIGLASPIFIMNVYDRILPNQAVSSLWVLAIGVILALLFDYLLKLSRSAIIDHTGKLTDQKLSYLIFEKVLNSQLESRAASTGEYTNRVSQYEFVREFFTSNTLSLMIDALFVFIFLIVIYYLAGILVIIPAVAFLLAVIIGVVAQQRIGKRIAQAANEAAERNAMLVEAVSTIETIKSMRAEPLMLRKWRELTKNSVRTAESIKQISSGASSATQFVTQMVSVFVVVGGAYQFSAGEISTGGIIATVMLSSRAIAPLGQITMTLARLRQAILSLKILNEIMAQPEDRPDSTGFVNRGITNPSIGFKDMEFTYPGTNHPVLTGLNLKISPGERVAIIGKIGSGKTTLGKLISGLYKPTGGSLLLDDIEVNQFHPQEIRKAVSFAGQNADLFSGTLKTNLAMGNPNVSDEELVRVAKITGVDEFASRHPRGYDMPVGERGERLSGGQKQAVAIARMLLTQSKIYYLDEPTGAMDLASERKLITALANSFPKEATIIIATHRYGLLDLVDRLLVLDNGRVVADGPKEKVLEMLSRKAKGAQQKTEEVQKEQRKP